MKKIERRIVGIWLLFHGVKQLLNTLLFRINLRTLLFCNSLHIFYWFAKIFTEWLAMSIFDSWPLQTMTYLIVLTFNFNERFLDLIPWIWTYFLRLRKLESAIFHWLHKVPLSYNLWAFYYFWFELKFRFTK